MSDHSRQPWDPREGEPARAFAAFVAYRDLGARRSLRKLAEVGTAGVKLGQLETWSSRHAWQARVAAWDRHLDLERQAAARTEARAWAAETARRLQAVLDKGLARIESLSPEEMTPMEGLHFVEKSIASIRRLTGQEDEERRVVPVLYLPDNGRDPELRRALVDGESDEDGAEEIIRGGGSGAGLARTVPTHKKIPSDQT